MTANEIITLLCKIASLHGTTKTKTVNPADPTHWEQTRLLIEMPNQLDPYLNRNWEGESAHGCGSGMPEPDEPIPEIVELVITNCYVLNIEVRSETYHDKCDEEGIDSEEPDCRFLQVLRKLLFDGDWTLQARLAQWSKVSGRYRRHGTLEEAQRLWPEYLEEKAQFEAAEEQIYGGE